MYQTQAELQSTHSNGEQPPNDTRSTQFDESTIAGIRCILMDRTLDPNGEIYQAALGTGNIVVEFRPLRRDELEVEHQNAIMRIYAQQNNLNSNIFYSIRSDIDRNINAVYSEWFVGRDGHNDQYDELNIYLTMEQCVELVARIQTVVFPWRPMGAAII